MFIDVVCGVSFDHKSQNTHAQKKPTPLRVGFLGFS
jgi:hypothetical protein